MKEIIHDEQWLKDKAHELAYGNDFKLPCPERMIKLAKEYLEYHTNKIANDTPDIPY